MEQDLRNRLAHNLKIERAKNKLTQEQLAELIEISPKHLTKIEKSKATPSIYMVYKMSKALNVSIDDLIN